MNTGNQKLKINNRMRRNMLLGLLIGALAGTGLSLLLGETLRLVGIFGLLGILVGFGFSDPPTPMRFPLGTMRKIIVAMLVFLFLQFAYFYLLDLELSLIWKAAAVLLVAVPAVYLVFTLGSAIFKLDEMQRRIQTEAIAISFGATFVIAYIFGMLGLAGLPQFNWFFITLPMVLFWAVGKIIGMRKYK